MIRNNPALIPFAPLVIVLFVRALLRWHQVRPEIVICRTEKVGKRLVLGMNTLATILVNLKSVTGMRQEDESQQKALQHVNLSWLTMLKY